jgi:hypothetical protein
MQQVSTFVDVEGLIPHANVGQGREEFRGDQRHMEKEDDQRHQIDVASKSPTLDKTFQWFHEKFAKRASKE